MLQNYLSHIFLIVLNVFNLMMFYQILLILCVVFLRDRFYPRAACVCLVCLLLCKEEDLFSSVSAITEKMDMGLYEVPLSGSLLGFGMVL